MKILFIDHDDSFSNNIVNFFRAKKCHVDLIAYSNPRLLSKSFPINEYKLVIFSPGPGSPFDYPQSIEFYKNLPPTIPVLGVCLGHQLMLYASGGKIQQICVKPVHGRQIHLCTQIVSNLLGKITLKGTIVLYHSLGCFKNDPVFKTWRAHIVQNDICLVAEHCIKPHFGVQFHPESFASTLGASLFNKFIRLLRL